MAFFSRVMIGLFMSLPLLSLSPLLHAQGREPADRISNCTAEVSITQIGTQSGPLGTTYKYRIRVTADAPTASVTYQVLRSYTRADGSTFKEGLVWQSGVRGGVSEEIGELSESDVRKVIDWSVENVVCKTSGGSEAKGAPDRRDAPKPSVCDLTGRWKAPGFDDYIVHLRSEGGRVTGHQTGPRMASNTLVGEVRSDGTVELVATFRPSFGATQTQRSSLRANPSCSRLEGTYVYDRGMLNTSSRSGHQILVKE
jgi:hypothetical protein